jgi:thymidylate kinase
MKSEKGKVIVLSGLSASGKTTLTKLISNKLDLYYIEEHKEWINKADIIKKPLTVQQNKDKQLYFLDIFKRRQKHVKNLIDKGINVICDSDFISSLAFNYAFKFINPELDVYEYITNGYIESLKNNAIELADAYIFLDCTNETRNIRRNRNDLFFTDNFSKLERDFFINIFNCSGKNKAINSICHNNDSSNGNNLEIFHRYVSILLQNNFRNDLSKFIFKITNLN